MFLLLNVKNTTGLSIFRQFETDMGGYSPPFKQSFFGFTTLTLLQLFYRYEICTLEAKNCDNLMSATIDGSDNGEYGFPYWADKTKGTQKGYKVKTKLYSMLVHNIGVYTYVFNAHLPGGTVQGLSFSFFLIVFVHNEHFITLHF